ncbi:hypothetical protein CLV31_11359 [Algoriphagus aquaeductus]|uniref:Uncharacterized protein n=1 Tax=Algoriphagus aquaeductus TaxID=475299 RepID=A0A326RLC9_9BACT|nr:hypothetical protein CLV31_11359 [Algoriphagus aquaeductus]
MQVSYSKSRKGKEGNGLIVGICFEWKISDDFIFEQKEGDTGFFRRHGFNLKKANRNLD